MSFVRFLIFGLLFPIALAAGGQELRSAATFEPLHDRAFIIRSVGGGMACTDATRTEAQHINARPRVPLRVFGEEPGRIRTHGSAGLNIILRGTAQLDANPAAKAAFERAAEIWESRIANNINVFVDVDFGTTRFGEPYGEGVLGSAVSDDRGSGSGLYEVVRAALVARGHNANETALYNALPNGSLPTDLGPTTGVASPSMLLRALGLLDANPPAEESAPSIGFNSAFAYDFDPSNGIAPGQIDFEGVVVHEIGHVLGFASRVGEQELGATVNAPTIFDFFRFRPDITLGTFGAANRIQASGGTQVYFTGFGALQLSTGRPDGTGGDERQASHWKDDSILGARIGVMDPTLGEGSRVELTDEDLQAFGMMGYDIVGLQSPAVPAAPSNLTAIGTSTTAIRLNWTDNSNNETSFRIEQKIGANFVDIGAAAIDATQINVTGFSPGQSATFRIRARNAVGDSAYSNEATGTTNGNSGTCTPSGTVVCLLNNRFRVTIDYVNPFSNPPNQPGTFLAARLLAGAQNPDTALFGFSSANAVEVVVRLQDTRPFAPRFDVYYGGMTDVAYTVFVTDTQTGVSRQYSNQVGQVGGGVDRSSFPASALGSPDRLMTSGGRDSFPAEPDAMPQPGDLRAATAMHLQRVRTAGRITAAQEDPLSPQLEQPTAKSLKRVPASEGAGACAEVEPNNTIATANALAFGVPCTGNASYGDSFTFVVDYGDGNQGRLHDIFEVTTGSAGPITATLTFPGGSGDLDVVGFRDTGTGIAGIGNASTTAQPETFTTDSLPAGTYYIAVSAFSGGSSYTLTVTGADVSVPAAPSNLTAAGISPSSIQLKWNDNSNNETGFVVEQKADANFVSLGSLDPNATAVNVTGFPPNTSATFRVKATGSSGDSAYSNEATGTTLSTPGTPCTPSSTVVCLLSNRFQVKIDYVNPFSNPPNQPGTFLAARLLEGTQNPDTALFGFSSAQAVEVVVRVQDTRPFAPRFDIYYGGMTDVGYTVTVTDTQTGTTRQYTNTVGTVGGGVDRTSFPAN